MHGREKRREVSALGQREGDARRRQNVPAEIAVNREQSARRNQGGSALPMTIRATSARGRVLCPGSGSTPTTTH